ncbi:deazapurine DNA modification protein DpdA family protein [Nocardia sp. NPDC004260]
MRFFLGVHRPIWLESLGVPAFVSHQTLRRCRRLPKAIAPWALDSGSFTQLQRFGSWDRGPSPNEYADRVRLYNEEIGRLEFAAPADWMCEPAVLAGGTFHGVRFAGTGLTVREHQHRTVQNFCEIRAAAPEIPIIPVIQGWTVDDYIRCLALYASAGVDLTSEATVGVGSLCRRQGTREVAEIIHNIVDAVPGIALHAFGVKSSGLALYGDQISSSDSMAWSMAARFAPPLPGCEHRRCVNCPRYALAWRARVLDSVPRQPLERAVQLSLFGRESPGSGIVSSVINTKEDDHGRCRAA